MRNIDQVCKYRMNGKQALEEIAKNVEEHGFSPYDLILMDVNMPIMDGYTATL